MRIFKRKLLSSVLALLLVICIFSSSMLLPSYAKQLNVIGQETERVNADGSASASTTPTETAVVVDPSQLTLDGSKSYLIFALCTWGGHAYGIGSDAAVTEDLKIPQSACTAGSTVSPIPQGLGWTLTQTNNGLIIQNNGRYLTVAEDERSLVLSDTEAVSSLTVNSNGTLSVAGKSTKTVYLQPADFSGEPKPGEPFRISQYGYASVFYFAEIQKTPDPSEEIPFPTLLPQRNFRAQVVSPDHVYGDDQYVIFTERDGQYLALNSAGKCSTPLMPEKELAVGGRLLSLDQNVLWTVNNNREKPATGGYYKYIRSCASDQYLSSGNTLLDKQIRCDFYLADKDGSTALLATADGHYVTLNGDTFGITADPALAARFYFAKLMQQEQQNDDDKTAVPDGTLLRLVNWSDIAEGKTYAIISATEFNRLHYALSGNGRLARYGADNLTNAICPNENVRGNGVHSSVPCDAKVGDIFYTNGQNIAWTVSGVNGGRATFRNVKTELYLKLSSGVAARQTASISAEPASVIIEPVDGHAYAYLSDGTNYLGIWQYVSVAVPKNDDECCAYYLAEMFSTDDTQNLPATNVEQDSDKSTVSFGGIYSVYQGSQHLLNDGTGVENFIMMDDGTGSFKPSDSKYDPNGSSNFFVTYCADYDTGMPTFTKPGKYNAVSLADYDGFNKEQKAALAAIIPNCYPYVSTETFLSNLKTAGFTVSDNCGPDEILAGIQAAIYTVTNRRDDGKDWGYESSDGWAHNLYEVNKPDSYVSDPDQAKSDVNTVRDYLWSLATPAVAAADNIVNVDGDYFAITTQINDHTWALSLDFSGSAVLMPYNEFDIRQMWYTDEHGSLQWFPATLFPDEDGQIWPTLFHFDVDASWRGGYYEYYDYITNGGSYYVDVSNPDCPDGYVPVKLNADGTISINDYENKLAAATNKPNDPLHVLVYNSHLKNESQYFAQNRSMSLDGCELFITPSAGYELTFSTVPATPEYPTFVAYDLDASNWDITYNADGSYNVNIKGMLNFPIRERYDDIRVELWCNGSKVGNVAVKPGEQEFAVQVKSLPDTSEIHFWLTIQQQFVAVTVFQPEDAGWQLQIGGTYSEAYREIHESTTTIPVSKVWADADKEDHSKDTVDLVLQENGVDTSYKITLSADTDPAWTGAFKHVPYERWTYYAYGPYAEAAGQHIKIPLETREYTVREINVKPGYTFEVSLGGADTPENPEDPEKPVTLNAGQPYPIQAVFAIEDLGIEVPEGAAPYWSLDFSGSELFAPYNPGNPVQLLYLNGTDTLVVAIDNMYYTALRFEPAEEDGKYLLYIDDPTSGETTYLSVDGFADKSQAIPFSFYKYEEPWGALSELPSDGFRPIKAALRVLENGQLTDKALCFGYSEYLETATYIPGNPEHGFRIRYHDGNFVIFSAMYDVTGLYVMFPCEEAAGEYVLGAYDHDENGNLITIYCAYDENGRQQFVEDVSLATHFAVAPIAENNDGASFEGSFTVTNTPNPGSLEVSKTVSGEGADPNKEFMFTVTLGDKTVNGTFGDMEFTDGVATFTLKHGEKITAVKLPVTTYEVVESDNDGYTVTVNGDTAAEGKATGTLSAEQPVTLAFNNDKPKEPTVSEESTESEESEESIESEDSSEPATSFDPETPPAGDSSNTMLWIVMLISLAAAFVSMFVNIRKRPEAR